MRPCLLGSARKMYLFQKIVLCPARKSYFPEKCTFSRKSYLFFTFPEKCTCFSFFQKSVLIFTFLEIICLNIYNVFIFYLYLYQKQKWSVHLTG